MKDFKDKLNYSEDHIVSIHLLKRDRHYLSLLNIYTLFLLSILFTNDENDKLLKRGSFLNRRAADLNEKTTAVYQVLGELSCLHHGT